MRLSFVVLAVFAILVGALPSHAQSLQTNVAVASNFTEAAKEIAAAYKAKTGNEAILSFGATGQFYTQIKHEAPFQVFLSADDERPKALVHEGLGVPESRFTYAVGQLVLWSRSPGTVKGEATLKTAAFEKIALANPVAAPYGAAAIEAMKALDVYEALKLKIVEGSNISQTFQFVDTGNAEVGFVALSQVVNRQGGSQWLVPQNLYAPIRQDAILLKKGADNAAAKAFIEFLKGPESRAIIARHGYAFE